MNKLKVKMPNGRNLTQIVTIDKPVDIIPDPEPFFAVHKKWSVVYTKGKTMEEVIDKLEKDNENLDDFIICKYQDEKIYMYKVHKEITKGGDNE